MGELLSTDIHTGVSTLAAAIDADDTEIRVASGDGAKFPDPGGDFFFLKITEAGVSEVVRCTWRQQDLLRVMRGQQATAARAFSVGAAVVMQSTVETLDVAAAASTVTQSGVGAVARSVADKLRETVSVKDFGAIGDGTSHPLSERFATLAAAQVEYPFVTALTQEIDWAATVAAIDSGATSIRVPTGAYLVSDTVLISEKVGLHIYGDSGGANGLGSSRIVWDGAADGVVMQVYSSSYCTIERLAIDGILQGVPSTPGIGLDVTALNADGSTRCNVFRDLTISAIGGTPGYGISLGRVTNDDISANLFQNIEIVGGAVSLVQFGTQTADNKFNKIRCLDYTSKGMTFIEGSVQIDGCSFYGLPASATIDCEIGSACLWAEIRNSNHEIYGARPVGTQAYGFTSGTRAWQSTLDGCRVLWDIASGYVVKYEQRGPLTMRGLTIDIGVGGVGNILLANGAGTPKPLSLTGNDIASSIFTEITGAWDPAEVLAMTEAARDAITWPAGRTVYNTTTNKLNLRVAAGWEVVTSA